MSPAPALQPSSPSAAVANMESMRKCGVLTRPWRDGHRPDCRWLTPEPTFEQGPERPVEGPGAGLQQQVRTAWSPLHLLLLGRPLAHHGVDRRLPEGRGDALAGPEPLTVVD